MAEVPPRYLGFDTTHLVADEAAGMMSGRGGGRWSTSRLGASAGPNSKSSSSTSSPPSLSTSSMSEWSSPFTPHPALQLADETSLHGGSTTPVMPQYSSTPNGRGAYYDEAASGVFGSQGRLQRRGSSGSRDGSARKEEALLIEYYWSHYGSRAWVG